MNVKDQILRDEGYVSHLYDDATGRALSKGSTIVGYPTIGVGFMLDREKGGGLRREEIEFILSNRLKLLEKDIGRRIEFYYRLSTERRAVLINMAFQMGLDGLMGFKNTLAMISNGDYARAAEAMLDSKWARQTPVRARRMARQMESGKWI